MEANPEKSRICGRTFQSATARCGAQTTQQRTGEKCQVNKAKHEGIVTRKCDLTSFGPHLYSEPTLA